MGNKNATAAREKGIRDIQYKAAHHLGGRPVVVGETGIPLDMEDGKAFKTGDFRMQELAMNGVLSALEVRCQPPLLNATHPPNMACLAIGRVGGGANVCSASPTHTLLLSGLLCCARPALAQSAQHRAEH